MIRLIISVVFLSTFLFSTAQDQQLFRGGCFLHAGYLQNNHSNQKIDGFVNGIGGKISFHVGDRFRIGSEGYVSNFSYKNNDGFYKIGWGGLLVEYQITTTKFRPVIGLTIGGGMVDDLYTISGNYQDGSPDQVVYKNYNCFVLSPNFSLEYSVNDHIAFTTKFDYNFYPGNEYPDYIGNGLRMYFGILFSR